MTPHPDGRLLSKDEVLALIDEALADCPAAYCSACRKIRSARSAVEFIYANNETLRAEVERLRADSLRLDAMLDNDWRIALSRLGWCMFRRNGESVTGVTHATAREAIDAALASTKDSGR